MDLMLPISRRSSMKSAFSFEEEISIANSSIHGIKSAGAGSPGAQNDENLKWAVKVLQDYIQIHAAG